MTLDIMFDYIDNSNESIRTDKWKYMLKDAHSPFRTFLKNQLEAIEGHSGFHIKDLDTKRRPFFLAQNKKMWSENVVNNSYFTHTGPIDWSSMKIGDIVVWTNKLTTNSSWQFQIWVIKLLDKMPNQIDTNTRGRTKDQFKFGYIYYSLSERGYSPSQKLGKGYIGSWTGKVTNRWLTGNIKHPNMVYFTKKGVWRKITNSPSFLNWMGESPFSQKA